MNKRLLKEYVDRRGFVTGQELAEQTGAAKDLWRKPAVELLETRDLFLCRLDHGKETFLSTHLLFCLKAVYMDPEMSPNAEEVFYWLCDHELSTLEEMQNGSQLGGEAFGKAFEELQRKLCVTPLSTKQINIPWPDEDPHELSSFTQFLWVTNEYWLADVRRPTRYNDLEYCLSEIKRLLKRKFTSKEINSLIYQGELYHG